MILALRFFCNLCNTIEAAQLTVLLDSVLSAQLGLIKLFLLCILWTSHEFLEIRLFSV